MEIAEHALLCSCINTNQRILYGKAEFYENRKRLFVCSGNNTHTHGYYSIE